jgi:CHAT domain-containing protein/Tfp pilus assembly protein PilF
MWDKRLHLIVVLTALWLVPFSSHANTPNDFTGRRQSTPPIFNVAQSPSRSLNAGDSLEREIKGGEVHSFTLSLAANQYVRLVVQKRGVDLFLNVIAPDGSATKYENPAGARSPILALIKAQVPGTYTLEIHPSRKWLAGGRYEIRLGGVDAPNALDETRLAAQQKMADGTRMLEAAGSSSAVLTKYEDALTLWRETGDTFQEANTLHFIAQTYKALRNFDKAEEYYNLALEKRGDDREARAYTLLDLAEAHYIIKGPLDSRSYYLDALAAFRENKNGRGQALALTQLGLIHMRQYDWEGAGEILQKALDIDRSEGDVYEETRVLNALGGVSDNQGHPERAMELYEQAREGFHRLGDPSREGNMYINIGLHYDTWGEWREAFASYNKALELLDDGEAAGETDRSFINSKRASAYYNIGSLYASLGQYTEGLGYLQKSLDLRAPNEQGPTLMWFGYTHVLSGEPSKALEYCDRAIKLQEQTEDPRRAQSYTVMGMAQDALGNHEKAIEYFDKALEIQQNKKTLDFKGQAITLDKRGPAFAALGEVAKGRRDLETALIRWRTYKDRNGEASSLFHLARIERDSGNLDVALANAEAATKLIEPLRANVVGQQLRASYFADKVDYYELYIDLLMHSPVVENTEASTITAFEASERARARGLLDLLSEADLASGTLTDPALARLLEKHRLLQRSILIKSAQRSQALAKNSTPTNLGELDHDFANLNSEQDAVEAQIRAQYPRYAALMSSQPQGAETIQQQLDDNTLLLEYSLGEKRSFVWAVTPNSIRGFELPGRERIEKTASRVIEALTVRNRDEKNETWPQRQLRIAKAEAGYSVASAELSKLIIAPLAAELGQKRLVVVADGALQLVPFGALPAPGDAVDAQNAKLKPPSNDSTPDHGPRLIDQHEIITLPSASVLALQRRELRNRQPAPFAVAVLADPVFDDQDVRIAKAPGIGNQHRKETAITGQGGEIIPARSEHSSSSRLSNAKSALSGALRDVGISGDGKLPRLSLSRQEARAIARAVSPGQTLSALDFKASRETATSPELSKYRIIHFATHGVLDLEHPELSGIVLSMVDEKGQPQDGYLRLHEIYNLNLPAEMVVLSACQTGIGKQVKGEGLIALTRGFMYAGAARVVASLWKVDDAATSELMAEFYKQMFTNKLKPAAAVRAAQVKMSQEKRWQSPYYWSGFFLQGEWN